MSAPTSLIGFQDFREVTADRHISVCPSPGLRHGNSGITSVESGMTSREQRGENLVKRHHSGTLKSSSVNSDNAKFLMAREQNRIVSSESKNEILV